MASFVVATGITQTTRIDMQGTDDLTVQVVGTLSVGANNQAVRFVGPTNGAVINNNWIIEATASPDGRAIRFETSVGANLTATINNLTGSALIRAVNDAIQIQAGAVTGGTVTVFNKGEIRSFTGQAIDFAGGTGASAQNITNIDAGEILADASDAIRFGGIGTLTNTGVINGGTAAAYTDGGDGIQFETGSSGSVTNGPALATFGEISGDRHGINAAAGTTVSVLNQAGCTITGRNGSGVGLDGNGSVINHGTITGAFANIAGSDVNGTTIGLPNGGGPDGINDGDGDGIDIDGQATIQNFGTIQGTGAGGSGSDGRLNTSEGIAAGGGHITNNAGAIIRGVGLGILIDDSTTGPAPFATTVLNSGLIQGTTSFAIKIIGTQKDTITNSGTISGGGGTAILMGGGDDVLIIGGGSVITGISNGEGGSDLLSYSSFTGPVTVNLATGVATGTGGVASFERLLGSDQNDKLIGSAAADTVQGGDGNDLLNGAGGIDVLQGGLGNDLYLVNAAGEADETGGGGIDTVRSAVSYVLGADLENLDLLGGFNRNATGNNLANRITGNTGNNVITGGLGRDIITGDAGLDRFDFNSLADSGVTAATRDMITDFEAGTNGTTIDRIDVLNIDANATVAGNQAFIFGGAFAAGHIRAIQAGADTLVQFNSDADATAEMTILLKGVTVANLDAGDFVL
jgi:Ca2+-binding RTX toxin-like protein